MGYPKDIDEYSDEELDAEMEKRLRRRRKGICTYCGRQATTPSCKFPERHRAGIRRPEAITQPMRGPKLPTGTNPKLRPLTPPEEEPTGRHTPSQLAAIAPEQEVIHLVLDDEERDSLLWAASSLSMLWPEDATAREAAAILNRLKKT